MVRIALVCDYALDRIGDAQAVVLREAELLRAAGDEVVMIGAEHAGSGPRPDLPGEQPLLIAATWRIPGVDMPAVRNSRALRARLRALFVARDIEVVHVHSEFGLTAAAVQVAQGLSIPVVHTVHTFFWQGPDLRGLDPLAGAAVRGLARLLRGRAPRAEPPTATRAVAAAVHGVTLDAAMEADAVISPSAHQAEALRIAGLAAVEVVPNPMPPMVMPGVPLQAIDGPLRILWVGRLTPESRVLEFLRAVVRAGEDLPPGSLSVTIVGDGPLLTEAREVAKTASTGTGSAIRFLGRVEPEGVQTLLRDSHLLAVTSFGIDPQPIVVTEAFRAARSVLYVDPRLREGLAEAGILCGSPDVKGMAAMLRELAHHPGIVVERSARTVRAAHPFHPEQHLQGMRDAWDAAARRAADEPS
ncbi:glycosyltransferase family 4 protein [Microbacterium sp. p3-SID336]|uniref:glycosyltransferase family 4 protein n=1 Tax=Microbacterium sp. p3-SID336 TaxID=2916212 RepID=UPI0021A51509|nr:glycosyltransferase family 4 protein [Microbacterium sp. p3-SID336]MCT1476686.1 glycosyltransferase family 4 protein [Microbacterium sp. p3-SID336]